MIDQKILDAFYNIFLISFFYFPYPLGFDFL